MTTSNEQLPPADEGRRSSEWLGAWQPIETAPQGEDDEFLGWDGEKIDKTWKGWEEDARPVYVRADWVSWEPTHWMPLPPPPQSA